MAYKDVTPPAGGKITISNGKLNVPENPDSSLHSRRRHRPGYLGRERAGLRCRGAKGLRRQAQNRLVRGVRRAKQLQEEIQQLAAGRHGRGVQGISRRHQRPADHAGRRRHPFAECGSAPDAGSLCLPAPGAVFSGRAFAGETSGKSGHGRSSAKTPRTFTPASNTPAARRKRRRSSISWPRNSRRISTKSASAPRKGLRLHEAGRAGSWRRAAWKCRHRHQAGLGRRHDPPRQSRHRVRAARRNARA